MRVNVCRSALRAAGLVALVALAVIPSAIRGARADEPKQGWSDTAELGYVQTSGNAESSTLGLKNTLVWRQKPAEFQFRVGAVRARSTVVTREAIGTSAADAVVTERRTSNLVAESYLAEADYARQISERFFWKVGAGWNRNEPAGVKNRWYGTGGVGNVWVANERIRFRTDYLLTYTKEEPVIEPPNYDDTFLGLRFAWNYEHRFTPSTTYRNLLTVDLNAEETDDWRADMVNSIAVALNARLALKASLQWLYDNRPAQVGLPVRPAPGADPIAGEVRLVELDELDTIFTTSLVINF